MRRGFLSILTTVALLAGVGTAWGYFTASGSGTSTGATSTASAITLSAAAPAEKLYPGSTADVKAHVSNPNSHAVKVASLVLDTSKGTSGYAVDATHANAGCSIANILTYARQNNGGSGFTVPSGTSSITLTDALAMSTTAAGACQGATFTVYLQAA